MKTRAFLFLCVAILLSSQRPVSTYSIAAYDEKTGELGVAVQSHWFSVAPYGNDIRNNRRRPGRPNDENT